MEGTGWGGQFWLHNGTALTKLEKVLEIGFPDASFDEEEVTHLESAGRSKEFIRALRDNGTFDVTMSYIPGSASDTLCRAAYEAGNGRPFKIVVPAHDGTASRMFTGTAWAKNYKGDSLTPNGVKKIVLTLRVTGAVTEAAAS